MADGEVEWAGEAGKALVTGGITTSIFGVVGAFFGFQWYESKIGPTCNELLVALGKCATPTLPIWGPVATPVQAATAFGTAIALATLVGCGCIWIYKRSRPAAGRGGAPGDHPQ